MLLTSLTSVTGLSTCIQARNRGSAGGRRPHCKIPPWINVLNIVSNIEHSLKSWAPLFANSAVPIWLRACLYIQPQSLPTYLSPGSNPEMCYTTKIKVYETISFQQFRQKTRKCSLHIRTPHFEPRLISVPWTPNLAGFSCRQWFMGLRRLSLSSNQEMHCW